MAIANIIEVPARSFRGLTYLPNGQQFSSWLPKGEYDVIGETDLTYSDLGTVKRASAVQLVNIATAEKWYVGVEAAEQLEREHKRPPGRYPQ